MAHDRRHRGGGTTAPGRTTAAAAPLAPATPARLAPAARVAASNDEATSRGAEHSRIVRSEDNLGIRMLPHELERLCAVRFDAALAAPLCRTHACDVTRGAAGETGLDEHRIAHAADGAEQGGGRGTGAAAAATAAAAHATAAAAIATHRLLQLARHALYVAQRGLRHAHALCRRLPTTWIGHTSALAVRAKERQVAARGVERPPSRARLRATAKRIVRRLERRNDERHGG